MCLWNQITTRLTHMKRTELNVWITLLDILDQVEKKLKPTTTIVDNNSCFKLLRIQLRYFHSGFCGFSTKSQYIKKKVKQESSIFWVNEQITFFNKTLLLFVYWWKLINQWKQQKSFNLSYDIHWLKIGRKNQKTKKKVKQQKIINLKWMECV